MSTCTYKILTDSACDLTQAKLSSLDVISIPLYVDIPGSDINVIGDSTEEVHAFFEMMRNGVAVKTSAVNVGRMQDAMEQILSEGYDLLYLGFDSAISSTYQNGAIAAKELEQKYPDRKIYTVDTLCASLGFGLLVTLVAEKRNAGASLDELYEYSVATAAQMCHWFTVDDLQYLKRGGRVSSTAAVMGSLLNIKPVLHVEPEGKLAATAKVRGRRKSLEALVEKAVSGAVEPEKQHMMICHADCLDEAMWVKEQLINKLSVKTIDVDYIGPVIGAHAGPGTIGLFYLGTNR